jgi:hypothetical protein
MHPSAHYGSVVNTLERVGVGVRCMGPRQPHQLWGLPGLGRLDGRIGNDLPERLKTSRIEPYWFCHLPTHMF